MSAIAKFFMVIMIMGIIAFTTTSIIIGIRTYDCEECEECDCDAELMCPTSCETCPV